MNGKSFIERHFPVVYTPRLLRWWSKLNGWNVFAFTIPFVILVGEDKNDYTSEHGSKWFAEKMQHEFIHIAQQLDFALVLFPVALIADLSFNIPAIWSIIMYIFSLCSFFVWYGMEYVYNRYWLQMDHLDAYINISFEREAFTMEEVEDYLVARPFWGWLYA